MLHVGLAVANSGTYTVDAPLIAVIRHLSDPSIRVRGSDGLTSDGDPYFVLDAASPDGTLAPGQSTSARTLDFYDPNGIQFTYDLVVLGQLNRPPAFTSEPNTEAIPGLPYVYQATATDADNDPLTFALLAGPVGMSVDPASGKVTWSPQQSDLGNQTVLLQVDDGHGGKAQQQYTVSTIAAPPNRPPLFTSTPVVVGNVDTPYAYQATAADPDGDPLTYVLGAPPVSVAVTNPSFETPVLDDFVSVNAIPGWTITGPADAGTFNPGASNFADGRARRAERRVQQRRDDLAGAVGAADGRDALRPPGGRRPEARREPAAFLGRIVGRRFSGRRLHAGAGGRSFQHGHCQLRRAG